MKKLEIYKKDNYVLNDAFDQSVMNIHILSKKNGYRSFVICGCEVGNGTTTVAINLAAALASSGHRTVLVDGDMRKKNAYKHLNENVSVGLSDYLLNKTEFQSIIYETTTDNLYYIPCGELIDNPVRLLVSEKMGNVESSLKKNFDFVIYDMPALSSALDAKVMASNADAAILVSSMHETSKKGLISAANALSDSHVNLIGTIVNKIDMDQYVVDNGDYDYFQKEKYVKSNGNKRRKR